MQSYDTTQYWNYQDWYATGYSKDTLINYMGYKKSLSFAEKLKKKILLNLKKHGKNAEDLIDTVEFILQRNF